MSPFAPDLFTAAGMTALAALLLAGVLRVHGTPYMRHGVTFTVLSSILLASACVAFAWQSRSSDDNSTYLLAKVVLSAAIACMTLAVQRFAALPDARRDTATAAVPMAALILISAWHYFAPMPWLHSAHAAVGLMQCLYLVWSLLRVRQAAPGHGWQLLSSSTGVLTVAAGAALYVASPQINVDTLSTTAASSSLLLWLVCMLPMLIHSGTSLGFLRMLHDRDHAAKQSLSQLDALTQLPNRAALVQHLENSIEHAATHSQPMAVMVLDIDHFKSVNDSYGHLIGDHVIQRIARTLVQQARAGDFSARYGGEEFVVVLPNTAARDAFHLAERLCQAVRKAPMPLPNGKLLHITVSVGVYAGHPAHGSSWERLVAAADEAMYVAKRSGRDRVAMSAAIEAVQATTTVAA